MSLHVHRRRTAPPSLDVLPEHSAASPVSIHAMTVAYQRKPVLWNIDYDAPPGQLIAIVGPNGAGKSTLIKAALGLVDIASGKVEFWGQPYSRQRGRIGYVPQRESVDWEFPVSALDVVCMGRYRAIGWLRRVSRVDRDAARACLDRVGMADFAARQISQLSGGQQQRVFIARARPERRSLLHGRAFRRRRCRDRTRHHRGPARTPALRAAPSSACTTICRA